MLHVFRHQNLELLYDEAQSLLRKSTGQKSVFEPEYIVVPNNDMGRWFQIRLAEQTGIAANLAVEMPASFMRRLYEKMASDYKKHLAGKNDFHWLINHMLMKYDTEPVFTSVQNYISRGMEQEQKLRRWQLSAHIADVFDQYQIYRPDWLRDWQKGRNPVELNDNEHAVWQQKLWQLTCADFPDLQGRADIQQELISKIKNGEMDSFLPKRITVFGVPLMAPVFAETFCELAKRREVYWYEFESGSNAEQHPFLELMSTERKDSAQVLNRSLKKSGTASEIHEDKHQNQIAENLLAILQNDLRSDAIPQCRKIPKADDSLLIHSCHGAVREVEVLQDVVLDYLNKNPEKGPGDILVMVPDINTYAPYVDAVFGSPENETLAIPYHCNDSESGPAADFIHTFSDAMMLAGSKFKVTDVMALLDSPPVREKFGFSTDDIRLLENWVRQTNIRWGWDASEHEMEYTNSWMFGIDRLLSGMAYETNFDSPVHGILPYSQIEGSGFLNILGKFRRFLEILQEYKKFCEGEHKLNLWATKTIAFQNQLLGDITNNQHASQKVTETISTLSELSGKWEVDTPVGYQQYSEWLLGELADVRIGLSYRGGRMIVTSMVPVRQMPFDFIALLGLNDQIIPARDQFSGFDLMGSYKRVGDRSRRAQDRAMFLETLLSAGEKLHLSYSGHNPKDNSENPPSVLISELRDVLEKSYMIDEKPLWKQIFVEHSLQGFSEKYLNEANPRLFTYSKVKEAMCRSVKQKTWQPFYALDTSLDKAPEAVPRDISIDDIIRFFEKPVGRFLRDNLGLQFPRDNTEELIDEYRDYWSIDYLTVWHIKNQLLQAHTETPDLEKIYRYYRAKGVLPRAEISREIFERVAEDAINFIETVESEELIKPFLDEEDFKIAVIIDDEPYHVYGTFRNLVDDGQLFLSASSAKPKYNLRAWLYHLAWMAHFEANGKTVLVHPHKSKKYTLHTFEEVHNPEEVLSELLLTYLNGQKEPFFPYPNSAEIFSQKYDESKGNIETARDESFKKFWGGGFNNFGFDALDDEAIPYLFSEKDPIQDEKFAEQVIKVWKLMENYLKREEV